MRKTNVTMMESEMTGIEAYNNKWDTFSNNKINANKDKPYLEGFYYFMITDSSYSTAYNYFNYVVNFVNECKIKDPTKIRLDHYTKFLSKKKTLTSSYRIAVYSALEKFSKYLAANGYCNDYMQYVKRPKAKETQETKDKREKGYMTKEEVHMFLNAVRYSSKVSKWKARDMAMVTILLNTGIRCSALQKLDIGDIDFENNTIRVLEKGEFPRKIIISEVTVDCIKEWLKYRSEIVSYDKVALFLSDRRRRITTQSIYNTITEYGKAVPGKHITPHKLRGTYGTLLYSETNDIYFVQQCMGHASPKTTEIYIRGKKDDFSKKASNITSSFLA